MVRVLVTNTIETYPAEWRLIHEPIQNAIDSFLTDSGNPIPMGGEEPTVTVELHLGSNRVVVRDNGKGIPESGFTNFLFLGDGTKSTKTTASRRHLLMGSQGVGIKSTFFTSDLFRVKTACAGRAWEMSLPGFASFEDSNFDGDVSEPEAKRSEGHSGTEVEVRLSGYSVWDFVGERLRTFFETAGLDYKAADSSGKLTLDNGRKIGPFDPLRILTRYFKRESYAGCVSRTLSIAGLPPIKFELLVDCDFPASDQPKYHVPGTKPLVAGSKLLVTDSVAYLDYRDVIMQLAEKARPQIVSDYVRILELGRKFERPTVFYRVLAKDDVIRLLGNLRKRRSTDPTPDLPNILDEDPAALTRNHSALERVNGAVLFVASSRFQRTQLAHRSSFSLSVNGVPTDILLEISGSELGYVPSVHFVLDVNETLGYGKRNLAPRSKGLYNQLGKDLWRTLHKLAKLLVAEDEEFDWTNTGTPFDKPAEFANVIPQGTTTSARTLELLGRVTLPTTEEDVIGTYFHLAGKGFVPAYRFVRLNDRTIYDGLAIRPAPPAAFKENDLLIIEFKRDTADLCKSDETRRQRFEDIQLAIVWEASPDEDLPIDYVSVNHDADIGYSTYLPGANYRLKKGRNSVQVLALKDIYEGLLSAPVGDE